MKTLKRKSEITAKTLKNNNCDYKGHRVGYDKKNGVYIIGSHFNTPVNYYETITDLKMAL